MSYKAANDKKIENAFALAQRRMNENILVGFKELLDAGVEYCLANHDTMHQRHAETQDSYGWVLLYGGSEIARKIYGQSSEKKGNASAALDKVKGSCPASGWVGVVLAGVKPETYFNVRYEFIPMRAAIRQLKAEDFQRIFTQMDV